MNGLRRLSGEGWVSGTLGLRMWSRSGLGVYVGHCRVTRGKRDHLLRYERGRNHIGTQQGAAASTSA